MLLVESVKTLKVGSVGPLFEDWALFVVVVREGCGSFGDTKLTIRGRE